MSLLVILTYPLMDAPQNIIDGPRMALIPGGGLFDTTSRPHASEICCVRLHHDLFHPRGGSCITRFESKSGFSNLPMQVDQSATKWHFRSSTLLCTFLLAYTLTVSDSNLYQSTTWSMNCHGLDLFPAGTGSICVLPRFPICRRNTSVKRNGIGQSISNGFTVRIVQHPKRIICTPGKSGAMSKLCWF